VVDKAMVRETIRSLETSPLVREIVALEVGRAIRECRAAESVEEFLRAHQVNAAYKYELIDDGDRYDAKAILVIALRSAFPGLADLTVGDLPGERQWVVDPLIACGFRVVDKLKSPETTLVEGLRRVLVDYGGAVASPFTGHSLGVFVRGSLADAVERVVDPRFRVKGSIGNGNWAETPWVAVFDPRITTSAQKGVYVVYLFDQQGRHVYLSLNQATTEVKDEFHSLYKDVLVDRATFAQSLLRPYGIADLEIGQLDLTGSGDLTKGYCAGNIAAVKYRVSDLVDENVLLRDLNRLLSLYTTYVSVRSGEVGEEEELPVEVAAGIEARKFRWHRRAERNGRLAADAKRFHGATCMVCGFNFEEKYGQRGRGYIEAHHVVPFAQLASEPEPVLLDPTTDFVVVCANCHRMLHRSSPAMTPQELRDLLR